MPKSNLEETVDEILKKDHRFDKDAYVFVREGVDYTVKLLKKERHAHLAPSHVNPQELLEGLRRYALEQFGPMARTVLDHWRVRKCEDFGEIVLNLVEAGILRKNEQDNRENFRGGFDFDDAFVKPFRPQTRRQQSSAGRHAAPDPVRDSSRVSESKKLSSGSN